MPAILTVGIMSYCISNSSLDESPNNPHLVAMSVSMAYPSSLTGLYFIEKGNVKLLMPYDFMFKL